MKTQNDLLTPQNINGLIRWNMPLRHPREPMKSRRYDRKLLIGLARYGGIVMRWGEEIKPPIKGTTLRQQGGVGTANNNKLHANNTTTLGATQASNSESIYRAGAIPMGYQTNVLPRVGECNKRSVYESTRILMTSLGMKTRSNNNTKKLKFDRSKLPSPESFWALHGIRLKLKKGWVMEESRTCTTGSTVEGRSHGYQDNL